MTDEKDVIKRMLDAKTRQPEYQRLDIEPRVGGRSLLHDEHGMLKVSSNTVRRTDVPVMKEISSDLISVKASVPSDKISYKKPNAPTMMKIVEEDDNFIPPKSNFVSVGHVEHAWYDDKVAGPSLLDNNEEVDIEKLQGLNPLADVDNAHLAKSVEFFRKRLTYIKSFTVTELLEVNGEQDLLELKAKIFGKKGLFTDILKQLDSLKSADRPVIGELVNQVYSEIQLEIDGKAYELESEAAEANEVTEWPEDMAAITRDDEHDEEPSVEETEEAESEKTESEETSDSSTVPEGHYAIIVDGKLLDVVENAEKAREVISKYLLDENLDLDSIQLIKRIKIDFGIILGE